MPVKEGWMGSVGCSGCDRPPCSTCAQLGLDIPAEYYWRGYTPDTSPVCLSAKFGDPIPRCIAVVLTGGENSLFFADAGLYATAFNEPNGPAGVAFLCLTLATTDGGSPDYGYTAGYDLWTGHIAGSGTDIEVARTHSPALNGGVYQLICVPSVGLSNTSYLTGPVAHVIGDVTGPGPMGMDTFSFGMPGALYNESGSLPNMLEPVTFTPHPYKFYQATYANFPITSGIQPNPAGGPILCVEQTISSAFGAFPEGFTLWGDWLNLGVAAPNMTYEWVGSCWDCTAVGAAPSWREYADCASLQAMVGEYITTTAAAYPILDAVALDALGNPLCKHGEYCSDGFVAATNPSDKGICCLTLTFSGIAPGPSACNHMAMEPLALDNIAVKYRHQWSGGGFAFYQAYPFGCLAPFPMRLDIAATAEPPYGTAGPYTQYTITATGTDWVFDDAIQNLVNRKAVFSATFTIPRANINQPSLWAEYPGPGPWDLLPYKITANYLASAAIVLAFDPAQSLNVTGAAGYQNSPDFTHATAALSLGGESWSGCGNQPQSNPFENCVSWLWTFSPVEAMVFSYEQTVYAPTSDGSAWTQTKTRQIVPIRDGQLFTINDSANALKTFQFIDPAGAPSDSSYVAIPISDDLPTMLLAIETAVTSASVIADPPLGFYAAVWTATTPADVAELQEQVNANPNNSDCGDWIWTVPTLTPNELLVTTVLDLTRVSSESCSETPLAFMQIGVMSLAQSPFAQNITIATTGSVISPPSMTATAGSALRLTDGVTGHSPLVFVLSNLSSDAYAGDIVVPLKWMPADQVAAIAAAIHTQFTAGTTAIDADIYYTPHASVNLHQTIGGQSQVVGSISASGGWLTGYNETTGQATATIDTVGTPGAFWFNAQNPSAGVKVLTSNWAPNAFRVKLAFDPCSVIVGDPANDILYYDAQCMEFCLPGGADFGLTYDPTTKLAAGPLLSCTISSEMCGYVAGSTYSLQPTFIERTGTIVLPNAATVHGGTALTQENIPAYAELSAPPALPIYPPLSTEYPATNFRAAMYSGTLLTYDRYTFTDTLSCTQLLSPGQGFTQRKTSTVELTNGSLFYLFDGANAAVFEWRTSGSAAAGNFLVAIGIDGVLDMAALIPAINGAGLAITAAAHAPPDNTCTLWQTVGGTPANVGTIVVNDSPVHHLTQLILVQGQQLTLSDGTNTPTTFQFGGKQQGSNVMVTVEILGAIDPDDPTGPSTFANLVAAIHACHASGSPHALTIDCDAGGSLHQTIGGVDTIVGTISMEDGGIS